MIVACRHWHAAYSPCPLNRLASYPRVMDQLFEQLKQETRQRILLFLTQLRDRFRRPGRVYLVGGTTMVLEGFR